MKESNKCPNCGATVKYNDDRSQAKCPYCNSSFEGDKNNSTFDRKTATIADLQIDEDDSLYTGKRPKVSVFIFLTIFLFFPFAAFVYLIVMKVIQKEWDKRNKK